MKSGKSHHEEEDEAYDDFGSKKDATPSTNTKGIHIVCICHMCVYSCVLRYKGFVLIEYTRESFDF